MNYSLNEIEALAKKAARGAGYSWGIAEEAGKAVRWLHQYNQDGCTALCGLLRKIDGSELHQHYPDATSVRSSEKWHAQDRLMCPLMSGAVLSDRALILGQSRLVLCNLLAPTLLFYFASRLVQQHVAVLSITWSGGKAVIGINIFHVEGILPEAVEALTIDFIGDTDYATSIVKTRALPNQSALACIEQFAQRTYAPASEASRIRGAGAGLSDND